MLLRRVERFNADFQLPVVICGSFNCRPDHAVYEMMESGVLRELPKAPFQMEDPPTTGDRSRSTIRVHWEVPHEGDAPITGYRIRRRAGGNTAVGFSKELEVHDAHARAFTVCQLSSGTMYEFIVAAVNAVGVGKWSDPSYPVATLTNFKNPPVNRSLQVAPPPRTELQIALQKQAKEAAIMAERKARGLAAVEEVVHADEADAYDSSDEEDYGAGYGYSDGAAGVGTYTGHGQKGMEVASASASSGSEEDSEGSGGGYDSDERAEREREKKSKNRARANRVRKLYVSRHGMLGTTDTNATPRFEDGRACLRQSPVRLPYASGSGRREALRVHCMCLKSAYAEYNAGAEPRCTQVRESHNATLDYIFYNDETLAVRRLLSVPKADDLRDIDPRAPDQVADPYDKKPEGWDDRPKIMTANFDTGEMEEIDNPDYQGTWAPRMVTNMDKYHSYLPNSQFSSDHFALMAEFSFKDGLLTATAWNSDTTVAGRAAPKTVGKK